MNQSKLKVKQRGQIRHTHSNLAANSRGRANGLSPGKKGFLIAQAQQQLATSCARVIQQKFRHFSPKAEANLRNAGHQFLLLFQLVQGC